jgi:hypothetical protein
MDTDMPKTKHKIAVTWQILYWLCVLMFTYGLISTAIALVALWGDFLNGKFSFLPFFILGILLYASMIFLFKAQVNAHILTSPNGLEYHAPGLHIRSSWENIEQIKLLGIAAQLGVGPEFIVLREPPEILSVNWYGQQILNPNRGSIPLLEFGQWRYTSLGDEIKRYAPLVFV